MNTRYFYRWLWSALVVLCLAVVFVSNRAAANRIAWQPQDAAAKASVETAGGLTLVTFVTNPGTIRVRLPNDIRAGDTISGTVIAEPKGQTKEEKTSNQADLKKFGIRLFGREEDKPEDVAIGDLTTAFKYALVNDRPSGNVFTMGLFLANGQIISKVTIPVLPLTPSGAIITPDPKVTVPTTVSGAVITPDPKITVPTTASGAVITPDPKITVPTTASGAVITPDPKITVPTTQSGAVITPDPKTTPSFIIPPLGQAGRPLIIHGPFDGDSSNTTVSATGFDVIAESPRQAIFKTPTDVTGSIDLRLTEGNTQTTGNYRNVGLNLTAPKTKLVKGEKTTLTVEVNGLQGITQPVPLTLTYRGVIVMDGGPYQPLVIQPSQVSSDGRYMTTRGITGVQTGGWTATATVVTSRFDFCLQDDSAPARMILWNTFTGDYSFSCPGCLSAGGGTKTGETTQTGGPTTTVAPTGTPGIIFPSPTGLSGTGTMIRKGCIITLTHNAPDRRIFARLDVCSDSATSIVEAPQTKTKFTITDRNTADNTCP